TPRQSRRRRAKNSCRSKGSTRTSLPTRSSKSAKLPTIRDAVPADCAMLSALAFASKAHWGYDDAFMEACRDELTVRPDELHRITVRIAVDGEQIVGFYGVDDTEIAWFFVRPDRMGKGIGKLLFTDACDTARCNGIAELRIEADPNAA